MNMTRLMTTSILVSLALLSAAASARAEMHIFRSDAPERGETFETVVPAYGLSPAAQDEAHSFALTAGRLERIYPTVATTDAAGRRVFGLRTEFNAGGPSATPLEYAIAAPVAAWEWGLRLAAYGDVYWPEAAGVADMAVSSSRIEYRRAGLTEWYTGLTHSLQHGFIVEEVNWKGAPYRPCYSSEAEEFLFVLEFELSGRLAPILLDGGQAAEFAMADGERVLHYGGLYAYDARGRVLPARIELGHRLDGMQPVVRLVIGAGDFVFPIMAGATLTRIPPRMAAQ